jgi:hypothetical protein
MRHSMRTNVNDWHPNVTQTGSKTG